MTRQNKYCCRCKRTESFQVEGTVFRCPSCGTSTDIAQNKAPDRVMIGNPFSFRVKK